MDDGELAFLKLFVLAQLVLLVVIVSNGYRGVPIALVILGLVAVLVHQLVTNTPFGRYLYAIGGNEEAAAVSGVPVRNTIIGAYAIMGGIVALTGFMQTAYSGASTSTVGSLMVWGGPLPLDEDGPMPTHAAPVDADGLGLPPWATMEEAVGDTLHRGSCETRACYPCDCRSGSAELGYGLATVVRPLLALAVWLDLRLGKGR